MDAVTVNSQCFDRPKFRLAGDRGLLVEFGDAIAPEINQTVRAMTFVLETAAVPGVREVIPTYRSVVIVYDPLTTVPSQLEPRILSLYEGLARIEAPPPKESVIPVCYGGESGRTLPLSPRITTSGSMMSSAFIRNRVTPFTCLDFLRVFLSWEGFQRNCTPPG